VRGAPALPVWRKGGATSRRRARGARPTDEAARGLAPLPGHRAPSCDLASQGSSLRSSGNLIASRQVHLATRLRLGGYLPLRGARGGGQGSARPTDAAGRGLPVWRAGVCPPYRRGSGVRGAARPTDARRAIATFPFLVPHSPFPFHADFGFCR